MPTAAAVANALYRFDGIRRLSLPMKDSPAARAILQSRDSGFGIRDSGLGSSDPGLGLGTRGSGARAEVAHVMSRLASFKELEVWQGAMDLAEAVYRLTRGFHHTSSTD